MNLPPTSPAFFQSEISRPSVLLKNVSIAGVGVLQDILIDSAGMIGAISPTAQNTSIQDMLQNISHSNMYHPTESLLIYDAQGLIALPGFVDLHVHLREPGREDAETIHSGSISAATGGYTAIFAMPNTDPVQDSPSVCDYVYTKAQKIGLVDVYPIGAVTAGQKGQTLSEMALMHHSLSGVRIFSDDGYCVHDSLLMRRALQYVKTIDGVIAQHAQDPRLTIDALAHDGVIAAKLGLTGWPRSAEEVIIARDIILAGEVDSQVHFCHISTAGSVEIIRAAKARGIKVTAEVTPHHLILDDSLLSDYDTVFKVNPPLRERSDILALREGLLDGTIDIIATDHAPHAEQDKACTFAQAKPGMLGLHTAAGIIAQVLAETTGKVDWEFMSTIMSKNPATIARLPDQGRDITVGEPANLVLLDPTASWTVSSENIPSLSRNTPYIGQELPISTVLTLLRGKPSYSADDSRWSRAEDFLVEV